MEDTKDKDIAVIRNDIDWIKKTISEKFKELSIQLDGIPIAIDTINKRIDSTDKRMSAIEMSFVEHLKNSDELIKEHKLNTQFREKSTFMADHFWKIVGLVGVPGILAAIGFIINNL